MKVIWALEAIPDDMKLFERGSRLVTQLTRVFGADIQPVHILASDLITAETSDPRSMGQYITAAERALEALLKSSKVPKLLEPYVITSSPADIALVNTLVRFSKTENADAIVVQTHARHGVSRFFLGSFAESLIMKSPVPVFVVNASGRPPQQRPRPMKRALFPTDFSDESRSVFEKFLDRCKGTGLSVVLFHQLSQPLETLVQGGVELLGGMWTPVYPYIQTKKADMDKMCDEWIRVAKNKGVRATADVRYRPGNASKTIISAAKKHRCDLIALASQSGTVSANLIGSVAREVIRHAPMPVWVFHVKRSRTQPKSESDLKASPTKHSTGASHPRS